MIVTLCLTMFFGGCSGRRDSIKSDGEEESDITITWWAFPDFAQKSEKDAAGTYENNVIAAFEARHPQIKVKLEMLDFSTGPEKIEAVLKNHNPCDVLLDAPGRIISYGKAEQLVKLDELFTKEYEQDVDNEVIINACKSGKNAYMYPLSSAPFYMAFNKKMLKDAGVLDLVREGWSSEDFVTVVKALKEKGYVPGSVFYKETGGDQATRALIANLYSSSVTDETVSRYTLNDEKGVKGLALVQDLVEKGYLLNGWDLNGTQALERFAYGQTSFSILWGPNQQMSYQSQLTANGVETVEVPYPSQDHVAELESLINGVCVFDTGDEERIEAAKTFIQFLCDDSIWGPANVKQTGCIPVRNSFGDLYENLRMQKIADWTKYYAPYYNTVDGFSGMRQDWKNLLTDAFLTKKDAKTLLNAYVNAANASMAE